MNQIRCQDAVRNLLFELSQSYFFKDQDPLQPGRNISIAGTIYEHLRKKLGLVDPKFFHPKQVVVWGLTKPGSRSEVGLGLHP